MVGTSSGGLEEAAVAAIERVFSPEDRACILRNDILPGLSFLDGVRGTGEPGDPASRFASMSCRRDMPHDLPVTASYLALVSTLPYARCSASVRLFSKSASVSQSSSSAMAPR